MDEKKIEEIREKKYIRSLDLLDLGRELRLAEKALERYREEGDGSRAEELEEYCEKLRQKIDARISVSTDK